MLENPREEKIRNTLLSNRRFNDFWACFRNFIGALIFIGLDPKIANREGSLKGKEQILKYMPVIREVCSDLNLNPNMIAALILTESTGKTCAMRFEPGWRWFAPTVDIKTFAENIGCSFETEKNGQATSWGLLQVMGTVAREHGFRGWFSELCQPEVGIRYGALHFKKMFKREGTLEAAVSSYNAGSVKMTPRGMFKNQRYVDKVMKIYRELESI